MKSLRFKLLLAFAATALLVAGGYYVQSHRSGSQGVNELAGARPDSKSEPDHDVSSISGRPEDLRLPPAELLVVPAEEDPSKTLPTPGVGAQQPRVASESAELSPNQYARYGAESEQHIAWLKRNKYPDDAHADLLLALDVNSLRALAARGDLAAQTELAYRLSRDVGTQSEASDLFKDAAVKGSREALLRLSGSVERAGLCSNAVTVNAHLLLAAMLGDISVTGKYVQCAYGMSPQDHGFSLVLAAKIFSDLNQEAIRRTGRPLQLDLHPQTNMLINNFIGARKSMKKTGG